MKFKSILAIAAATAAIMFTGCSKDEEEVGAAEITIKREATLNLAAAEASQTVSFVATRDWTATVSDAAKAWLSVSPTSGKASSKEQSLKLEVLANPDKDRMGTVTISILSGSLVLGSKTITVNQAGEKGSSFVTIAQVREQAPTGDATVTIADGTMIKGSVLSNTTLNNLSSKKILYIQDATGGVQLFLDSNSTFARGDVVSVDLSAASMKLYNGMIEIDGVKLANVAKVSDGTLEAKAISMDDFLANKYESQYIALEGVQVAESDLSKTWYTGSAAGASINMEDANGNTFVVRSSKYSSYASEKVPQGSGTIKGIAAYYSGTLQLYFTEAADYAGLTGARVEPVVSETTIADVLSGKASGKVSVEGVVVGAGTNAFVLNDGGEKNLYVYDAEVAAPAAGKSVKVEGTVATYGSTGLIQLTSIEVSDASKTYTAATQTAKTLDAAAVDAYSGNWSEYVTITGTLKKSGNYYNVELGGTTVGSLVASSLNDKLVDGTVYDFTGYFGGISGSTTHYFNVLPVSITESSKPIFGVSTTELTAAATATSATFTVKGNCAWTASSDNADFTVEPASGTGVTEVKVKFSANTDTENAKVANIKVSTTADVETKEYTVVVTQNKAASADAKTYVLDGDAIKAAHNAAWSYTSGEKSVTATDGSVWTLFNTYCSTNQVTVQMNKGKGAYVLTPTLPDGMEVKNIAVVLNKKNDGTGEMGDRPMDILSADGKTTLLNDVTGQSLANGLDVAAGNSQVQIVCDETNGGAVYITSITVTYAAK